MSRPVTVTDGSNVRAPPRATHRPNAPSVPWSDQTYAGPVIDDAVQRVADLLATEASSETVGRERERARLTQLIGADRPVVVFVHGAGGIGKTALVRATLAGTQDAGVWLDARHVEPTEAGVLVALSEALGTRCSSPAEVGAAVAAATVRTVVVDDYQRFAVVDGWLRNELLPALPDGTTTLFVGRNAPNRAWRATAGWRLLVGELVVGPLSEIEARELVDRHLLPPELARRALAFGRGHPLALQLAAEAFARHPDLALHAGPPPEVVEQLVDALFDDLDAGTRQVVDGVSVLRRITLPLLTAVLADEPGGVDVHGAWRTIRELPFMSLHPTGLEMQPVIQEVAATALELRDPGRTRELRRRAGRAAFAEIERGPGWEATADLLHLVQNPVIRDAFLPPAGMQHPVERAHRDDLDAIVALVARHEGERSEQVVRAWWERHRDAFHVLRNHDGGVAAFSIVSAIDAVDPTLESSDPVLRRIMGDMADRPLGPGERALLVRRALASRTGDGLSAELAPMIVDLKRTYLALRPHLARVYAVAGHWTRDAPTLRTMGFEPQGAPLRLDSRELQVCSLEFGPGSVDGWLARHIETETTRPDREVPSGDAGDVGDAAALRELSAREREVLAALARGLTNRELADLLFISERTANRHVSNIFLKLGVHNRTAAARVAVDAGLA